MTGFRSWVVPTSHFRPVFPDVAVESPDLRRGRKTDCKWNGGDYYLDETQGVGEE